MWIDAIRYRNAVQDVGRQGVEELAPRSADTLKRGQLDGYFENNI